MSYLMLPEGVPDLTKAVISLWFRIPQASIDAAAAEFEAAWNSDPDSEFSYGQGWNAGGKGFSSYSDSPPQMAGIIPLIVFGQKGTSSVVTPYSVTYGSFHVTTYFQVEDFPITVPPTFHWEVLSEEEQELTGQRNGLPSIKWTSEPSYIGIWCTGNPKRALLAVNLETAARASVSGVNAEIINLAASDRQKYIGNYGDMPPRTWTLTTTFDGTAGVNPLLPQTECFRTHPLVSDIAQYDDAGGITVVPDQWHHLLLSFDLSTPCKTHGLSTNDPFETVGAAATTDPSSWTDSAPKMWIAFDDVNKTEKELSYYWSGTDPNEIISPQGWLIAGLVTGADQTIVEPPGLDNETTISITSGLTTPIYNFDSPPIPTQGQPIGLPGTLEFVDHIHAVEMAEFLMFTDVTLDTSGEGNRRLFITKLGKPVNQSPIAIPINKLAIGDPATWEPGADIAAFVPGLVNHAFTPTAVKFPDGDKPITADIDFTKCSLNWIMGNNMGTASKGGDKPEHTGKIIAYFPDPVLKEVPGG